MTNIIVQFTKGELEAAPDVNPLYGQFAVGNVFADLLDYSSGGGVSTGVPMDITDAFLQSGSGGSWANSDFYGYPEVMWQNCYLTENGGTGEVKLSNLPPSTAVTIVCAGYQNSSTRDVDITVQGETKTYAGSVPSTPAPPLSFDVVSSPLGEVFISCTKAAINGSFYGALNFIDVTFSSVAGPQLTEPSAVLGDGAYVGAGASLSATETTITAQWSLDDFNTIDGSKTFDVTAATDTSFSVDVKSGWEESEQSDSGFERVMHTGGAYKCRWVYKDDQDSDITLEFTNVSDADFNVAEFDISEFNSDENSLLYKLTPAVDATKPVQQFMRKVQDGVTLDFSDTGHPQPNYIGGNSETGPTQIIAVYNQGDGKCYRSRGDF